MAGGGATNELPAALQDPQNDVLLYENGTLDFLEPSGADFGPEITFGRTIADEFPAENFALIKYAVGGTDLENEWDPAGPGPQYTAFRNTVSNGLAALQSGGNTTEIIGMLWTQGERDARQGYHDEYEANLNAFIADLRKARKLRCRLALLPQSAICRANGPAGGRIERRSHCPGERCREQCQHFHDRYRHVRPEDRQSSLRRHRTTVFGRGVRQRVYCQRT
jgi:hypothetical protein